MRFVALDDVSGTTDLLLVMRMCQPTYYPAVVIILNGGAPAYFAMAGCMCYWDPKEPASQQTKDLLEGDLCIFKKCIVQGINVRTIAGPSVANPSKPKLIAGFVLFSHWEQAARTPDIIRN